MGAIGNSVDQKLHENLYLSPCRIPINNTGYSWRQTLIKNNVSFKPTIYWLRSNSATSHYRITDLDLIKAVNYYHPITPMLKRFKKWKTDNYLVTLLVILVVSYKLFNIVTDHEKAIDTWWQQTNSTTRVCLFYKTKVCNDNNSYYATKVSSINTRDGNQTELELNEPT